MSALEVLIWMALVATGLFILLEILFVILFYKVGSMFGWGRSKKDEEIVSTNDFLDP